MTPAIYYATARAIAAVLPAATPIGNGTLTVTYKGTPSTPFPIQVVPSAYGFDTYGDNMAVVTDAASGSLITSTSSAKPGQIVILWGTGLGPDSADSDNTYTSSPHAIGTQLDIYVGGVKATNISYAGGSVYPGVHVVGFTIPPATPNGCYVPVIIVTAGTVISNTPRIPVADNGGVCSEPLFGIDGATIAGLTSQPTIRLGQIFLVEQTLPTPQLHTTRIIGSRFYGAIARAMALRSSLFQSPRGSAAARANAHNRTRP